MINLIIVILMVMTILLAGWLIIESACTIFRFRNTEVHRQVLVFLETYTVLGVLIIAETIHYFQLIGELDPTSDIIWNIIINTLIYLCICHCRFFRILYKPSTCPVKETLVRSLQIVF